MQASDRVLAWRYSRALFMSACQAQTEDRIQNDLAGVYGLVFGHMPLLRHPRVPVPEKKRKLEQILSGKAEKLTVRFLKLLIDKKRFELLPLIAADFSKQLAEKNNQAKAMVRSAAALSPEAEKKLKEKLKNFIGKNVELEVKIDPEILGGVVVRLGDWVLDSSLRGRLRMLSRTWSNGNAA